MGNQVEVFVGGDLIAHRGVLGDGRTDATKAPLWVPVPARLLSQSVPTVLEIRVAVQAVRWGGLAAPRFGPEAVLQPQYRERYVWRQWGAVAVVFALALTGVIAAGLWHLNREPVYGYFALCAPFGMLRFGDRLWSTSPLGWPVWGGIVAFSLAVHVLLLVRFSLALIGRDGLGARRAFWVLLLAETLLVSAAFGLFQPEYWTAALGLLFVPAVGAYVIAAREAIVARKRGHRLLYCQLRSHRRRPVRLPGDPHRDRKRGPLFVPSAGDHALRAPDGLAHPGSLCPPGACLPGPEQLPGREGAPARA